MKSGLLFQNVVKICSQFQYQLSYTYTESLLTHIHMATYKHTPMYIMHPYIDTHAYMNAMPGVVIKARIINGTNQGAKCYIIQGWIQGGLWGLETPSKIYQKSQNNDVLVLKHVELSDTSILYEIKQSICCKGLHPPHPYSMSGLKLLCIYLNML